MQVQADPLAAVAALPGVDEAVERSRVAVDRLRGHKVLRSRSAQVTAESALRGARASAALAGADWPLEELRRRTDLGDEPGAAAVRGALRISGELSELLPVLRQAPAQALTRMHLLAAAGTADSTGIGRPRLAGEKVEAEPAMPQPPVDAQEAAARLTALTGVLASSSKAPALVVASIAHAELLSIAAFGWGDGLIARALFRLLLVDRGLDPNSLAVPEVGWVELGLPAYREALAAYAQGTAAGIAEWITACAQALELGAQESMAVCEALMRG
ncbi:oxidoreductase [Actinospica durhamensis]|uniref:oxidoreductase n=1 Tax=Actinospica durhamensis TaxID=1508375 RepID=UPI0034D6E442